MRTLLVAPAVALAILLAGCDTGAPLGLVTAAQAAPGWEKGPSVGLTAPVIRFADPDGKQRTISAREDWMTLIGFVRPGGADCCMLSSPLTNLAARYWDKPIRVVQLSLPTKSCPHGPGCVETCKVEPLNLVALCDAGGVADRAFGAPRPGTVILVGPDGKVLATGSEANLGPIQALTDRFAAGAEKRREKQVMGVYD